MTGVVLKKKKKRINYINKLDAMNFIKISSDMKTIIFANMNEIFILEMKRKYWIKREIGKIYNETIRFVK